MKQRLKDSLLKGIVYGTMIGNMVVMFLIMSIARTQDWVITLDFNVIGEGIYEYMYMFIWLFFALYLLYVEYKRKNT